MAQVGVWVLPDGTIRVTRTNDSVLLATELDRVRAGLPMGTILKMMEDSALPPKFDLVTGKSIRHQWRLHPVRAEIILNPLIPDPPRS